MLQAYATYHYLTEKGLLCEEINYSSAQIAKLQRGHIVAKGLKSPFSFFCEKVNHKIGSVKYRKLFSDYPRNKAFEAFINKEFRQTEVLSDATIHRLADEYNVAIVGGDQVWNPTWSNENYFLDFVKSGKRVAFSCSIGKDYLTDSEKNWVEENIETINAVSVREDLANKLLQGMGIDSIQIPDPVFLLTREEWQTFGGDEPKISEPYLFSYLLGEDSERRVEIKEFARRHGLKIVTIPHLSNRINKNDIGYADIDVIDAGPKEFVNLICNANFVMTDSFHGTAFSLILNKPFKCFSRFGNKDKDAQNSRLKSVLKLYDEEQVYVSIKEIANSASLELPNDVREKRDNVTKELRKKGQAYLDAEICNDVSKCGERRYLGICKKSECTGCGACAQSCPQKSISMKEDEIECFEYPIVDLSRCNNCGLCQRTCPVLSGEEKKETLEECLVGYNVNDTERMHSSSGAIFPIMAKKVLSRNGVVFGAVFSENRKRVHHIGASDINSVTQMFGSKYVQSSTKDSFAEAKKYLESGREVLYSGTACQINALKAFLQKEYDNLFTVDVVCHGVASPRILEIIENSVEKNTKQKIKNVNFRSKDTGWKNFSFKIDFAAGKAITEIFPRSAFGRLFVNNICLRENCYACKFKDGSHGSDITIGDAWGIEKYRPKLNDDKGASVIVVHTPNGNSLIDDIKGELRLENVSMADAFNDNCFYFKSVGRHALRDQYLIYLAEENPNIDEILKLVHTSFMRRVFRKIGRIIKKL